MATGNLRNVRVDDDVWLPAGARARDEDTNLSTLIRGWLADYAAGEPAGPTRGKGKIRLSAAERRMAIESLAKTLDPGAVLAIALDAVNQTR